MEEPREHVGSRLPPERREMLVQLAWIGADAAILVAATFISAWVRYDLVLNDIRFAVVSRFALCAAVVFVLLAVFVGPYRVPHLRGSFEETTAVGRAALTTAGVLLVLVLLTPWFPSVPRSLPLLAPVLGLTGMYTLRFVVRSYRWGRRATAGTGKRKVVILGAGTAGRRLIRALHQDPATSYVPVALLDDDPRKRRLTIDGLHVSGTRQQIAEIARRRDAGTLVIAIPSADSTLLRELREIATAAGLSVLILPKVDDLIHGGRPQANDLREINLEDLLGRHKVELDDTAISRSLHGKTVLVTGAGGSIGSELARQISRYDPKKLVLLDRDESALHAVQMSLTGRALLDDGTLALVNIRDLDALLAVFRREQPDIVFHAAALKHLTLLEQFPAEGWKTNVLGTLNVLRAADATGVDTIVNVSTDKAANPTCVLGYTKRLAERLTAAFATRSTGRYVSVRFGNVLGSRGSVIEAFTAQIQRGGPLTVTHPEVERYFMLIPEASQLVLQASAIGQDGDVMVLDMGSPVKIADLAHDLIDFSGRDDIDIVYTGLRPGEKLSEVLFYPGDDIQRSSHPMVNRVGVPSIAPESVQSVRADDTDVLLDWMRTQSMITAAPSDEPQPDEVTTSEHPSRIFDRYSSF